MNKEELIKKIEALPLYEKRRIKIKTDTDTDKDEWVNVNTKFAVCEVGGKQPWAFISPTYHLIQFKSIFLPIVESIEGELDGDLSTYGGYCRVNIFPQSEEMKDGKSKFGLTIINSIDMSSSVVVRFCVETGNHRISLPSKIGGLKKMHTKGAEKVTQDYLKTLGAVKAIWGQIITEFPKYKIVDKIDVNTAKAEENVEEYGTYLLEFKDVMESLDLGLRTEKEVKRKMDLVHAAGKTFNLWELFTCVLDKVSDSKYTSDIHMSRKIDQISEKIFLYSTTLALGSDD